MGSVFLLVVINEMRFEIFKSKTKKFRGGVLNKSVNDN